MTQRVHPAFWYVSIAALLVSLVVSAAFGGQDGVSGMALGTAGSLFNLWALWAIIGLSSRMTSTEETRRRGTFLIVLAFFVKLPVFIALGSLAQRVGGNAPTCFLLGIALVYSALVGWALARR